MNAPQNGGTYTLERYGDVLVKTQIEEGGTHYVWFRHDNGIDSVTLTEFNTLKK